MVVETKFRCFETHSTSIQLRFDMFKVGGGGGEANGFNIAAEQNRTDFEANGEAVCPGLEWQSGAGCSKPG